MLFFQVDHIGWVTQDISKFERFWCNVLGYEKIHESHGSKEMMQVLFETQDAIIRRYKHPTNQGPLIEIHHFPNDTIDVSTNFQRHGINHVCLLVGGRGSRELFLEKLPRDIEVKSYQNPGGWKNIFIRDYESNWIELREVF